MEDKKTVKVTLGTVICIIIICILIVALIVMYFYYHNNSKSTDNVTKEVEKVETNVDEKNSDSQVKKVDKLDESKEIVYSSYSNFSSEYSYSIPYINIDSDDANKINREIEEYYKPLIEEELEHEAEGRSVTMISIKYNAYINDNVLSLVISHEFDVVGCIYYKVYNLDIYNGNIITNSDLVKAKNMTESEFIENLKEIHKDKFVNIYGSKEEYVARFYNSTESEKQENSEEYEIQFGRTTSSDNCSIETPIFLNDDGKISVIVNIYALVGGDSYYYIINTNI